MPRRWTFLLASLGVLWLPGASPSDQPAAPAALPTRFRQPVAACFAGDGIHLLVANRRSGSLSVVDTRKACTVAEHDVGRGLAALAALPGGERLLAVDQADDSLLLIELKGSEPRVVERLRVSHDPVELAVTPDGTSCVVASRRSRRLTFVDLAPHGEGGRPGLRTAGTLGLPFSPQEIVFVRGGRTLIAAAAYGGRLAVVDPRRRLVERVRKLPGHNIRGLAESPDGASLVVAHQLLLDNARTTYEDIHWGLFVNNDLTFLGLDRLLGEGSDDDVARDSRVVSLGDPGHGAGDPACIVFDRRGHVVVALAGVDEVMIGTEPGILTYRPEVGRRPLDVAIAADGKSAYVVNSLDDTIAVVEPESGRRRENIALGPTPETTSAERGERMFTDARLSHGGWMSCHSCHADGHTSGLNSDTLGDGGFGAPKRIPSLLGVAETGPWGWTGRFERLEDQVRQSIESTMQGQTPTDSDVSHMVAYLRTLTTPSPAPPREADTARGREIFRRECSSCHAPPLYSRPGRYDVGLVDEKGNRKFNPPSLRGVGANEPLLHDGRAATLGDVFTKHKHPDGLELSGDEVAELVAFLRTL